jgi:hypothetical protein
VNSAGTCPRSRQTAQGAPSTLLLRATIATLPPTGLPDRNATIASAWGVPGQVTHRRA